MSRRTEALEAMNCQKTERDPNQLYFCCPKCGHSKLTWVWENVTTYIDVDWVHTSGQVQLGEEGHDDAVDYYVQCAHCGSRLMDDMGYSIAAPGEELVEWLRKNCDQEPR